MRGIRPHPRLIWFGAGALVVSLIPNLLNLNEEARQIRGFAGIERSQLGALELLRDEVPAASIPGLEIDAGLLGVDREGPITASRYFAAVDRYGSPADSPATIAAADESLRRVFDQVLLEGNDLALLELPRAKQPLGAAATRHPDVRSTPASPSAFLLPALRSGLRVRARR